MPATTHQPLAAQALALAEALEAEAAVFRSYAQSGGQEAFTLEPQEHRLGLVKMSEIAAQIVEEDRRSRTVVAETSARRE